MSISLANKYLTTSVNPFNMIHLWNKSTISFTNVDMIYNKPIQLYVANPVKHSHKFHESHKSNESQNLPLYDLTHTTDPYETLGVTIWKS